MPWLHQLIPLPAALPLLLAAVLAGIGGYLPRRVLDLVGLLTCATVMILCCILAYFSAGGTLVYWFGNWRPSPDVHSPAHFPVGICFVIDPLGAGLAALVGLLSTAAFAFSWAYFEQVKSLYHALMLAFVGAMCGLCLTGDLFNLFVWFELMTAAAVGLCGYKSEESWPLLGALNFAVVNTIGAFLSLGGVALLYARTGSLNMAEVGRALASAAPGGTFIMIAFMFVAAGFLVKMAAFPFHFWLADAHAVAPTPVCVLFSGVMVELGLFAVARLFWQVFAPAMGAAGADALRDVFLLMGALTALAGAVYCFGQRHLKRMLAFSTISHVGIMITGFAMLDPGALSGAALYTLGHGMVKGALFLGAGILLHRSGSVDEHDLRSRGKNLATLAIILPLGGLALAGVPPFAMFFGESQMRQAAIRHHEQWLTPVTIIAEALTAGAVLRFSARLFLGWGKSHEATSRGAPHIPMDKETAGLHDRTPVFMWLPAMILLLLAAGIAIPGAWRAAVARAAEHFEQTHILAAVTLDSAPDLIPPPPAAPPAEFSMENIITPLLAITAALLALFHRILGQRINWLLGRSILTAMRPLRRLQSGKLSDYVALFVFGIAAYCGLLLILYHRWHTP